MRVYCYIRVSTDRQNTIRQENSIREYYNKRGIEFSEDVIFNEKISGKKYGDDRSEFAILKRVLRAGDELVVDSVDRLGRTRKIISEELHYLHEKGVIVRILNIPTTLMMVDECQGNDWVLEMVTNIIIEVYTAVAEQELEEKERRTRDGIEAAKAAGKYKGRKPIKFNVKIIEKWYPAWKRNELMTKQFQELLGLKPNTFYRVIHKYEQSLREEAG